MLRPITMSMAALAITLASALAACAPKGQEGAQGTGDSTASPNAFTDSATAQDSIGPAPSVRDSVGSKSTGTAPQTGEYIGRDSAFGPSFTVDSMGNVTPIAPVKKKP